MLRKLSFIIISISTLSFADCTENESESQILSRLEALSELLENQDDSALDFSQHRLYIDPRRIRITDQGSMLYTKGEKNILLPELFSCENGVFVKCSERDLESLGETDELRIWWCPRCRAFRKMDNYGRCRSCGVKL